MSHRAGIVFSSHLFLSIFCAVPVFLIGWMVISETQTLAGSAGQVTIPFSSILKLVLNTLYVSLVSSVLSLATTYIPAFFLWRHLEKYRKYLLPVAILPLLIPTALMAIVMVKLFSPGGLFPVQVTLEKANGSQGLTMDQVYSPIYTLTGAAVCMAACYFPISLFILLKGFSSLSKEVVEAMSLDGSLMKVLHRGLLRGIGGYIALSFLLVFLLSTTNFAIPEALRSQPVLVSEVYTSFAVDYNSSNAIKSFLFLLATVLPVLILAYRCVSRTLREDSKSGIMGGYETGHENTKWSFWTVLTLLAIASVSVSLTAVLLYTVASGPEGFLRTLKSTWITTREDYLFSLSLSALSAAILVIISITTGIALSVLKSANIYRFLLLSYFILPGPFWGIGMKTFLLSPAETFPVWFGDFLFFLDSTTIPLMLVHVLRFSVLGALLIEIAVRSLPSDFFEVLRLHSESVFRRLQLIMKPVIIPGGVITFFLSFALILGETGASLILLPPGPTTTAVRVQTLLHYAPDSQVSALALFLLLPSFVSGTIVILMTRIFQRSVSNLPK